MKIVTVVGARPQFIKAAAVSGKLRKAGKEILIHTGQHYDRNMSDIFFEELGMMPPDYYLGVGSASHARQTADIMTGIEKILLKEKPDFVLVYGDTNSTLAAALAAAKLLIPIIHIEAGVRSFNKTMPEEQNRILTDHISSILFCPTDTAAQNLASENIKNNVYQVGDVMCDAVLHYADKMKHMESSLFKEKLIGLYSWEGDLSRWYLATVHRAENTTDIGLIRIMLEALEELDAPVIFPVHPRIRAYIEKLYKERRYRNLYFVEPLGYLEMLFFVCGAIKVITDSGGLQKEAFILHKNVVTLREQTEWIETLAGNHNILCKFRKEDIIHSIYDTEISPEFNTSVFGDGNATERICKILCKFSDRKQTFF